MQESSSSRPPSPERRLFGRILAQARASRRLSQEALAFEADYHPKYISQLERGINSPSLTALLRLGRALGVPASELVRRVEEALPKKAKSVRPK